MHSSSTLNSTHTIIVLSMRNDRTSFETLRKWHVQHGTHKQHNTMQAHVSICEPAKRKEGERETETKKTRETEIQRQRESAGDRR